MRNGLHRLSVERDQYCGIPMPLDDLTLIIEPTYPRAQDLARISGVRLRNAEADTVEVRVRNTFWSTRRGWRVIVFDDKDGRVRAMAEVGSRHQGDALINTIGAADAWGLEQEERAEATLRSMLRPRQWRQYRLTGSFIEMSARSGVSYIFRRLRPTIALRVSRERVLPLCALCMHPIAHYGKSWAGAMCPTDDVIAHLAMMRGDEVLFWRRSNQHAPGTPLAGF